MRRQYNEPAIDDDVKAHPQYSFDMEVLATLPPWSEHGYASHRDIVWDHRLNGQGLLKAALERLGQRFKIKTWATGADGMGSAVRRMDWKRAMAAASVYWEVVHGD